MSHNKLKILCVRCGEKVLPENGSSIYIHYTTNEGKPLKTPRLASVCECGTKISKFIPKNSVFISEMIEKYTDMDYDVRCELVDDNVMMNLSSCSYGRKISGGCKKKPGRRIGSKSKKRAKPCKYGKKISGGCRKKPGRKSRSKK